MENWKRKLSGRAIDRLTLHRSGEVVWLSFPILDRFDFLLNGFSTPAGGRFGGRYRNDEPEFLPGAGQREGPGKP